MCEWIKFKWEQELKLLSRLNLCVMLSQINSVNLTRKKEAACSMMRGYETCLVINTFCINNGNHFQSNKTTMFHFYKQTKCLFECRLRFASGKSKCIPWDYPHPEGLENEPFCTSHTLAIFEKEMDNAKALDRCECQPDCDHDMFKVHVSLHCNYLIIS